MRILLAHNIHRLTGGADVFYFETGKILKKYGHQVAYFSSKHEENIDTGEYEYFTEVVDYKNGSLFEKISGIPKVIYSKTTKERFREAIDTFKPDIVHAFATYSGLTPSLFEICPEANIPLILSCNDYKHICPNYKLFTNNEVCMRCKGDKFYNAFTHKCLKDSYTFSFVGMLESYVHHNVLDIYKQNVSTFCFSSQFMADKTKEFWSNTEISIDFIRNPFDSTVFKRSNYRGNYCLYFGRLSQEKGVELLLEAMKDCPNVKLKIIGDGPEENRLKKTKDRLNLENVDFLGARWDDELNKVLKKARFVIVPSEWHENFPYVINQSFAYGITVIGSDRGGIPEMIGSDRGLIFKTRTELSDHIKKLWNNPQLASELGDNAKKWSDINFNSETFYRNVLRVYKKVIGRE